MSKAMSTKEAPETAKVIDEAVEPEEEKEITWGEVITSCCVHDAAGWFKILLNFVGIAFCLYWFIFSLELLSIGAKVLTGCSAGTLFGDNTNPVASLIVGILVTVMLQSSSTTTSIIVSLVGAEAIPVEPAIYMVMGANIGTSVTNTIVAIGQMGNGDDLERAFAGATVHDCFNFLSVLILFPLECATHMLAKLTGFMVRNFQTKENAGSGGGGIKVIIEPILSKIIISNGNVMKETAVNGQTCAELGYYPTVCDPAGEHTYQACAKDGSVGLITCDKHGGECPLFFMEGATQQNDVTSGLIALLMGIIFLVICLGGLVSVLKGMLLGGSEAVIKKATNVNGYLSMMIGCGITMAVQSSSVTTSVLTPIVGVGIITVDQMYPLTLGANIGTTVTSLLAALVAETSTALQVGLAHLLFNVIGILIWYPIPFMRAVPLKMCKMLGKATRWWKGFPFLYIFIVFVALPLLLLGVSSLFVGDSAALVTLGVLLCVFVLLFAFKFLYWWFRKDGRAQTEASFKRRQYKKDIMLRIVDEFEPLVESVNNIKAEIGLDVENGGKVHPPEVHAESLAHSIKMESAFRDFGDVSAENDPAYASFITNLSK